MSKLNFFEPEPKKLSTSAHIMLLSRFTVFAFANYVLRPTFCRIFALAIDFHMYERKN